ncbi:mitotic checkpoint serine/threonine-protein kinase BUB1-like [Macrobrachium nipponense]|uniref:mitotic checkpoint serine/threonine-protein kinase BUB1-like n=1 Tax=Macrobrachium nipponense TaxID=159736 RepID=UPI0030C82884
MEAEGNSESWELSKENIQPLKQGRNASVLSVALDDTATRKLNSIRHEFEEELRTYSGDDPLDVWYRYILWVEQNYPKGGKDGNLKKLIQNCIISIQRNSVVMEKYKNDGRFLSLWIKYANISPNPLEVYSALESKDLCTLLADFYINWSWELERLGNFKRADAIYQKGLEARAVPFDVLDDAHKKFQNRVARATVEGRPNESETDRGDVHRIALTALKVQGKKNKVANERVGSTVLGPAGRVSQSGPVSNAGGPTFNIYQDNGNSSAVDGGNCIKGGSLPIRTTVNKENVKDPTKWTKAKVSQKTSGVVPLEDVGKHQRPAFAVHEDAGVSQLGITPSKLPATSNVLSVRENFNDWNVPLFVPEPFDPKVQPQYCKHEVYCGTEEFSFEELRAANYFKEERRKAELVKKEQERDAQIQQMRDMIRKQEMMLQQLFQSQQQLPNGQAPQITVTSPHETNDVSVPQKVQKKTENKDQSIYHDSWICMNKSVIPSINQSVNASLFLEENSTRALQQPKPVTLNALSSEIPEEQGHNFSSCAPNNSGQDGLNHSHSSHSNSRGLNLTDPTVNTKMAMNAINDMWSVSLFKEDSVAVDVESNAPPSKQSAPFAIFQDNACGKEDANIAQEAPAQPFTIFRDDGNQGTNFAAPFTIHQDQATCNTKAVSDVSDPNHLYPETQDENAPPEGFKQEKNIRTLAGVLQPTTNVPMSVEDEKDVEDEIEEKNPTSDDNSGTKVDSNPDDNLEGDFFPINGTLMADFTLKMPNNPEAFAKSLKIASTPAYFLKQDDGDDKTIGNLLKQGCFFPFEEEEEEEEKKEDSGEVMPPPSTSRPVSSPHGISAKPLSPIMEASREYKSSSSSSSGYSTTSTLCSNSIHGVTQYGGLSTTQTFRFRHNSNSQAESVLETGTTTQTGDFTKSGYLADKSRGESIAETKHKNPTSRNYLMTEEEGDTFDAHKAAMMLMEMDRVPVPSPPKAVSKGVTVTKVLSENNFPEKINPFCKELVGKLLDNLNEKVETRGGYVQMDGKLPLIKPNVQLTLGKEMFYVRRLRGEGAYAKVFQAATLDPLNVTVFPDIDGKDEDDNDDDDEHQIILKLQKPSWPWEFYICHELRSRLKAKQYKTDVLDSIMRVNRGYFFTNGSILVNEYHKHGTLLDVVNRYKLSGSTLPDGIAILFMIEVMSIVEALHSCNIIHADIKPDNFLIRGMPKINCSASTPKDVFEQCPSSLKLIDFGRSIDMQLLPEGSTFTEVVKTEGFTCCEMREGKPWTYETDYYGVAAIAYCFLFGSYMDVKKNSLGKWELKQGTMKRYWKRDLWQSFFSTLLNSPSPNSLSKLKEDFMRKFVELIGEKHFSSKLTELQNILAQKL